MSATLGTTFDWRKLLDNPLPVYQDTGKGNGDAAGAVDAYQQLSPWQQALATTKQDTGWSGPSTQVPYSAPSTTGGATGAGQFGYDYSGAAPGYNAWALYNGGTQDGGWYNAAADTQQWDSGRGNGSQSNTRDTIWRWTLDDLKAQGLDPGKAPVDVVNRAFLKNVARMHRDFDANKLNWQQSGFANFDRVLPGGGSGGQRLPGSALPNGGMSVDYGTQGGGTVADVNGGGGYVPPVPTTVVKQGANNPNTQGARFGQFQTPDLASVLAEIQADPSKAAMVWRMMNGQTVTPLGRMADTRNSLYGKSLQALLGLGGLPGMGSSEDLLAGFYDQTKAGGPGLLGLGNSVAGKLGGMDLGALKSEDLDMVLSTLASLQGLNMGKIGRSGMATQLENVINQDWARNATGGVGADAGNYAGDLDNTGYGRSLAAYLGLQ
jgi:hypothetical protein